MAKPRRKLQDWMRSLGKPQEQPEPLFAEREPAFDIGMRPGSDTSDMDYAKMDRTMRARYSGAPLLLQDHERPQHDQALSVKRLNALRMADERATAGPAAQIASQQQLEKDVLARAIAALPVAMRKMVEETRAALEQAEKELAEKNLRLLALDSSEDSGLYAARHSQLTSGIDALEDLVKDRRAEYSRMIKYQAGPRLDDVLDIQADQAAHAHAEAKARYAALLAESRAELGRLASVQTAIGRVRSELESARTAEQQIGGRVVTPQAPRLDKAAERDARQRIALQLQAGAK
jgi:phage baseplate assembly protein W